jgi:hypothetical protein
VPLGLTLTRKTTRFSLFQMSRSCPEFSLWCSGRPACGDMPI